MAHLGDTWGSIRGVVRGSFSFAQIKDVVGAAGLPVHRLAHLRQELGGASKGQLMDAVDELVGELEDEGRDRFVTAVVEEVVARNEEALDELEVVLNRVGWGVSPEGVYPLRLQIDIETAAMADEVREGVSTCLRRYRDGDFDGAITAICGVVDHLTEQVYAARSLGNHRDDSYQQRISKAFTALEAEFRAPLAGVDLDDADRIWHNHRGAMNQAAYVLGAFRREFSDAHGAQNAAPGLVQRAIDCAVFIVRGLSGLNP